MDDSVLKSLRDICRIEVNDFVSKFRHYSWLSLAARVKRRTKKVTIDLSGKNVTDSKDIFTLRFVVREEKQLVLFKHLLHSIGHTIFLSTPESEISTDCFSSEED